MPRLPSPRVSAIVSLYRAERFVRNCLDDLISQTLFQRGELEIVVIDSASPEGEWGIVSEYVARFPDRIRALRTPEREGLYAAWNRGIRMARGTYVTNANADDRHRLDALEILAKALDDSPDADLAYADCIVTFRENETVEDHVRSGLLLRPEWRPEILSEGCHMGPQPVWRRSVHERIGFFDESYRSAGDYEFWCRMAASGMSMVHVPELLGLYQENPHGICNADPGLGASETLRVREAYAERLPPTDRSWIDNRVYPVKDPEEYAHLMVRVTGPLPRVEACLGALLYLTAFPHRLTVIASACTADVLGFLETLRRQGIVHRLLTEIRFDPEASLRLGTRLEPKASWQVLLGSEWLPARRDWLSRIVRPCGAARRGRTELVTTSVVDLSIFPDLQKRSRHPGSRPVLWVNAKAMGRKRTLEARPHHGLQPLVASPPRPEHGPGPFLPLAGSDLDRAFVHIVMISYNRLDFTRRSIESLHGTASFPYKLTVMDNNSSDGSREWLEGAAAAGQITRLCALEENVGVARAANLGWTLEPSAAWFLKLDNDMVMQREGWLEAMIAILEGSSDIGMVAANVEPTSYPLEHRGQLSFRAKHGTLGGACVMVPQRIHDQLGFWSEAYGKYGEEDYDYGFRVLSTGRRNVYLPDEDVAFHLPAGKAASITMDSFTATDGLEESIHREYRQEKDASRRNNHLSKLVHRRIGAYLKGTEPLRQPTVHQGPADSAPRPDAPHPWPGSLDRLRRQVHEDTASLPRPGWSARMLCRLGFGEA